MATDPSTPLFIPSDRYFPKSSSLDVILRSLLTSSFTYHLFNPQIENYYMLHILLKVRNLEEKIQTLIANVTFLRLVLLVDV